MDQDARKNGLSDSTAMTRMAEDLGQIREDLSRMLHA